MSFRYPVDSQAGSQVVPVDGREVPAAVVDRFVRGDCRLRAIDAVAQLHLAVVHREEQEIAEPAVVEVDDKAVRLRGLELEGEVASGARVPAQVASPLTLRAGKLHRGAESQCDA